MPPVNPFLALARGRQALSQAHPELNLGGRNPFENLARTKLASGTADPQETQS